MVIQRLLFPNEEVCNEWEMFLHSKLVKKMHPVRITRNRYVREESDSLSVRNALYDKRYKNGAFFIPNGDKVSLQTYFNSFSIAKWRKYTEISNLKLHLSISGRVKVTAYNAVGNTFCDEQQSEGKSRCYYRKAKRKRIDVKVLDKSDGVDVVFPGIDYDGIIYVVIEALEDVKLYGGEYITQMKEYNNVNIGLCFCTYKREQDIKSNVNRLLDNTINNPDSPLYEHLEIFVVDNGKTLDANTFESDKVHIIPNNNVGGAGGFTRGMIEAVLYNEPSRFSHVILMDDDIVINPEMIERNLHFLRIIKDEYSNSMIGGELFELDKRYLQFEAGARYEGTIIQSYNQHWDMRLPDAVSANEVENPINYNGWWYSCIPAGFIREDNLPIPVFIHRDDVEYGMRGAAYGTILLNGLCVWHPQYPNKASAIMDYYDIRNELICMCDKKEAPDVEGIIKYVTGRVIGKLLRYRYNEVYCIIRALEDYYRGPVRFMKIDPIDNHNKLSKYNYDYVTHEGYDLPKVKEDSVRNRSLNAYLKSALCFILPSQDTTVVTEAVDVELPFRARQMFFYDEKRKMGFLVEKSYKDAIIIAVKYVRIIWVMLHKHSKITRKWADAKKDFTSLKYWEKYLELN